jgi:beta-lactamase regulating signal transducer with metallopeptidase domain
MTAPALDTLAAQLLSTSVSSAMVALGVWVACRCLPGLPAAARATLWWIVALKLLVGLLWVVPVTLPVLPATWVESTGLKTSPSGERPWQTPATRTTTLAVPRDPSRPTSIATSRWSGALAAAWLAGLMLLGLRFGRQLLRSRRMLSRAGFVGPGLDAVAIDAARHLGLSRVPELSVSDEVSAPMLVGLSRPRIVVPQGRFASLSVAEQRMALAHELAHYRRGDLWWGLIPALAERVFFFHPVAWLAAREYLVAREAACDAEVVDALGVSPRDYGRLLLALGVTPVQAQFAAAGSSHTFSNLKRRVVMLGLPSPTKKVRIAGWAVAALAVCALVPVRLVGRTADAGIGSVQSPAVISASAATGLVQPEARRAAQSSGTTVTRDRDRLEYALILSEHRTIMSGHIDSSRLDGLRGSSPQLLWFKLGGRQYVVRDAEGIGRAEQITRVMREIGAAQGEVGAKQGAIGAQQGEVGAKQGAIGAKQGTIGAKQGEIGAKQSTLAAREMGASDAQRQQLDRQRAELDAQMRKLDEEMRALDAQMREADRPMAELDAKMRVLDDEMRVLDGKMREAEVKVKAELRVLFEKLISEKMAEPLN